MDAVRQMNVMELAGQRIDVDGRSATLQMTYALLAASVLFAALGGYIGSHSDTLIVFFTTLPGWIAALILLNAIPAIAIRAIQTPTVGLFVLGLDGFVSGLVIAPVLWLAKETDPTLIPAAIGITAT